MLQHVSIQQEPHQEQRTRSKHEHFNIVIHFHRLNTNQKLYCHISEVGLTPINNLQNLLTPQNRNCIGS